MRKNIHGIEEEDLGYTMADVPSELNPLSILIEVAQHLEIIKTDLIQAKENEEEFANVLKSLKYGDNAEKHNKTLSILLQGYQRSTSENEDLKQRIENLEQEKFKLE